MDNWQEYGLRLLPYIWLLVAGLVLDPVILLEKRHRLTLAKKRLFARLNAASDVLRFPLVAAGYAASAIGLRWLEGGLTSSEILYVLAISICFMVILVLAGFWILAVDVTDNAQIRKFHIATFEVGIVGQLRLVQSVGISLLALLELASG